MKKVYLIIPGVLIVVGTVLAMRYIPAHSQPSSPTLTPTPPEPTAASQTAASQAYIPMLGDLINIIYASDPNSPLYDPESSSYAEFSNVMQQLSGMGPKAINAASHIALAISFPREDSYLAAQALISLGPDITATTLPILIDNLHSQRAVTRLDSAIVLGTVGKAASCSVGDIVPLLWDADPSVRSAAAYALARITGEDLFPDGAMVSVEPISSQSIVPDIPEGKIVGDAREWWNVEGSKVNWHPSYDLCDP